MDKLLKLVKEDGTVEPTAREMTSLVVLAPLKTRIALLQSEIVSLLMSANTNVCLVADVK